MAKVRRLPRSGKAKPMSQEIAWSADEHMIWAIVALVVAAILNGCALYSIVIAALKSVKP